MEEEDTSEKKKSETEHEVQSGDVVLVDPRKSSGDVREFRNIDEKKSSTNKKHAVKSTRSYFANTRRKMRSFRRGVKKFWDLWSGFTRCSGPVAPKKKKSSQTLGVPGFEEIACIDVDMPDIMVTDKDKIRTSCKQCLKNPPKFPTKDQVKSKLIAADKYYGVNKSGKVLERSGSLEHDADYFDEDGKIIRPSWRFILERPLVEQYVLMTNYIRKMSVLAELEGLNEQSIEEADSLSDTEYENFTQKHKIEMENFVASIRAPMKKEMGVQTSNKSSEVLPEPASETSLYPDSGSSDESSPSKRDLSAITIITSHDLSSPQQSDLENRQVFNGARVKNAVKWWESKDPPQMSESFQTSCDSVHEAVSTKLSPIHNEPVEDTSGSGSDGRSIPVHNATGKTSFFELNTRENYEDSEAKMLTVKRSNLAQNPRMTVEKATTTQKKVTFSPVVEYFSLPQKKSAFPLSNRYEDIKDETREVGATLHNFQEINNDVQNRNIFTLTPTQKQIVLQLGSSNKEGHRGFSIVQNHSMKEIPGVPTTYFKEREAIEDGRKMSSLSKAVTNKQTSSSTEYRSTSPETVVISSSDYRSSPVSSQFGVQRDKESKESSSNSSERIELKPSPAVFFRPGDAITSLATDNFYPEVPDINDGEGTSYGRAQDELSTTSHSRAKVPEARQSSNFETNQDLVKLVIVRGSNSDFENKMNQIPKRCDKGVKSIEVSKRNESGHLQSRASEQEYSKTIQREVHENCTEMVSQAQPPSHVREVIASRSNQNSVYSTLLDDLFAVASPPLDKDFRNPTETLTDVHQSNVQSKIVEQHKEVRISRVHQHRTVNHHQQNLSSGISTTRPVKLEIGEEQWDLKGETPYTHHQEEIDVQDRNTAIPDNPKGLQRANNVPSILPESRHILRKIPEEHDSSTEISLVDTIQRGAQLESQGKASDWVSYDDLGEFDVLKVSQIYSSSSSFVTPSEERMASGLNKVEATLFTPIVVENITPEVTMMPSTTGISDVSSDRANATANDADTEINEVVQNTVRNQEQKVEVQEINYRPSTQIQYPRQLEMLIPCYSLVGNVQFAKQTVVEIKTDKMNTTAPQDDGEKEIVESNIELLLQKVFETINDQTGETKSDVKHEDANINPKQWLMDVIPTVTKISIKPPARPANPTSTHPPDGSHVKPVFKFLKRQKEMEENNES